MAIARTGATSANAGGGSTAALSINTPTGGTTIGNVMILQAGSNAGLAQIYSCSGFTAIPGFTPQSANNLCSQWLFYRICNGTEGATFTVASTTAQRQIANLSCYSGVDTANPFCGINQGNNDTNTGLTFDFPSTNVTASPAYGVLLVRDRNATSVNSITPVTGVSSGYSLATESSNTAANFNHGAIMDEHAEYTGTPTYAIDPGDATVTPNLATRAFAVLFLKPFVAPTNTVKTLASMGVG
jgi:hypothetical protein